MSPISTEEIVEGDLDFRHTASHAKIVGLRRVAGDSTFKPGLVRAEISAGELVVEEQLDIGGALQLVE